MKRQLMRGEIFVPRITVVDVARS